MPYSENDEFEMFHFFEMTPDLVYLAGKEGFFKNINQAVIDKLGYPKEELFSRPIHTFIHPEDKELTRRRRAELLLGKALINFDNRYVTKSGSIIWLHWTSIYYPEKEVVFAIAKDITERKLKETEIEENYKKFKALASHFKTKLETDKKYLATELHEELAQLASVAKMNINWVIENTQTLPEVPRNKLADSLAVLNLLVNSIRKISYTISPNMLYDVGLNETLHWLCTEFSKTNDILCFFDSSCDDKKLPYEMQLDIFRICEGWLLYIIQYAEANAIFVKIESSEDSICLSIKDNGKGTETEKLLHSPKLDNLHKRVASINGQLTFKSEKAQGTSMYITIALPTAEDIPSHLHSEMWPTDLST